ncbi:hypothetical protein D3C71_1960510 [compost metagenome]
MSAAPCCASNRLTDQICRKEAVRNMKRICDSRIPKANRPTAAVDSRMFSSQRETKLLAMSSSDCGA